MRVAELPLQTNALPAHDYGYRGGHLYLHRANSRGLPVEPLRIRVEIDFHWISSAGGLTSELWVGQFVLRSSDGRRGPARGSSDDFPEPGRLTRALQRRLPGVGLARGCKAPI